MKHTPSLQTEFDNKVGYRPADACHNCKHSKFIFHSSKRWICTHPYRHRKKRIGMFYVCELHEDKEEVFKCQR